MPATFTKQSPLLYFGLLLTLLLSFGAHGQTADERRKAREKTLLDSLNAMKQRQDAAAALRRQRNTNKNNQAVFGDEDPIFKTTQIPDKWKDESAVVLAAKTTYHYYTKGTSAYYDRIERKRIKVLDKSAVDNLSTFYFIPTKDVGFTLIKKDGTTTRIKLDDAVPVDDYMLVPTSYMVEGSVDYMYSKSYKKLAISGLESGDIIDYYYTYNYSAFKEDVPAVPFPAVALTLTSEYPVVSQKIRLKAENGFFINFAAYNGASSFVKVSDTAKNANVYVLADSNRSKRKNEKWEDALRCEPTIKFQVIYSSDKEKNNVPYFLGSSSALTTSVSQEQLKRVANEIAMEETPGVDSYSSAITKYMRKNHSDIKDPILYMKYAYTYFRYVVLVGEVGDENNESGLSQDMDKNLEDKATIESQVFVKVLGEVCKDKKIDYDLLFGVPSNIGTLSNLIYPSELKWVLYIKGSPGIYLFPFDLYKVPGEADWDMEGIDMYKLVPDKKIEKVVLSKTSTPISDATANTAVYKTSVSINADMQGGASVNRNTTISGLIKEHYYPNVIAEGNMLNQELKRYKEETMEEYLKKIHNNDKKKEEERKITVAMADEQKERIETMKTFFSTDFDVSSYDDFQLQCDGRQVDSAKLMFNDKFKLKDVVHKVGPNYIVDAGKFIGKQYELKEEQRTRTFDIYLGYAGEYDNEVSITIPQGYTVQGLDALNKNITTKTGGFVSTATLSGNTLTIKTRKFYLHNFEPKENWPDMVKFLEAAYDFTQAKILLKKA
jgi:hypothetical protein